MNFIQKHWKGEYPLWRAFWINFILADFILMIGFSFLFFSYLSEKETAIRLIFNYGIVAVFLAVWQTVGIWRSGEKYIEQKGKKFWASLVQLFTISCLIQTIISLSHLVFSPDKASAVISAQIDELLKKQPELAQQAETPATKNRLETNPSSEQK